MNSRRSSLSISVRRHFIDAFFFRECARIKPADTVIDIGGKRENKRGLFDIGKYSQHVLFVNIDPTTTPDILADAQSIPVPDDSQDVAIMGELLEHVYDPRPVLQEAYRILRPGGTLLITVPFMYPEHADPNDYGRYTASYWKKTLGSFGFTIEQLEPQGTIFAVAATLVQQYFSISGARTISRVVKGISRRALRKPLVRTLLWLDARTTIPYFKAWTTGFGIVAQK